MGFVKTLFKWLKFIAIAVVSLLTLIVIWYLWTQRIEDVHYPVIDTGIWPLSSRDSLLWLDNERMLILTTDNYKPSKNPQLYVMYNVKTNQISNTHLVGRIQCDRNGQFFYRTSDPADDTVYRANLNHSEPHPKPEGDWMMDVLFDCDWVLLATSTAGKIKYIYPYLLKLHGNNYLEIFENGQTLYHAHLGDAGVPYPTGGTDYYSEYLDAYINSKNNYDPDNPESSHFWVTKRDGQQTKIPYPSNMFISDDRPTDHDIYPIRPGYLIHYFGEGFDYKTNGLYLIIEGKLKHVLSGFIRDLAIAPNGCIAAFGYAKNVKEDLATVKDGVVVAEPKTTVKLIDFCAGVSK